LEQNEKLTCRFGAQRKSGQVQCLVQVSRYAAGKKQL